ncbi:MAG: tetraacyldisaccharide 4'-kinase [Flavobacteriales bacterium]|nr:MAG: tetraacyldisaccharide 4'-kinase [Flavobacteriales bacterium]
MQSWRKILYPFSLIYGEITTLRNRLYNRKILKSTGFDIPIITVGNLSVGGTGKTPQIEYLIRLLSDKCKVAVLSRGYKRSSSGFIIADKNSSAKTVGDEPLQYFKKFQNIIVAVDADRVNGITNLLALASKPDVILLDDAFQHRKVKSGLNILLTQYGQLYSDDTVLPTGNLREKKSGADRAEVVVVTKCPDELSEMQQFTIAQQLQIKNYQTLFFSKIVYADKIIGKKDTVEVNKLKKYNVLLVTGIAKTNPLTDYLTKINVDFKHLKFADHYVFKEKDFKAVETAYKRLEGDKKIILTTEKDYVRSFEESNLPIFYLPIKTEFIDHQSDFDKIILNYVEQSTRNR